jgi:hypothetical protein
VFVAQVDGLAFASLAKFNGILFFSVYAVLRHLPPAADRASTVVVSLDRITTGMFPVSITGYFELMADETEKTDNVVGSGSWSKQDFKEDWV